MSKMPTGRPRAIEEKIGSLKAEMAALEREAREEIPADMQAAQSVGPVRENADMYLVAGRAHYVQGRLASLRQRLQALQSLDLSSIPRDRAGYGSLLDLRDVDTGGLRRVRLVSPEEVEGAGEACSLRSPMGRALLGRRPGDEVEVAAPGGFRCYEIVALATLFDQEDQA